MKNTTLIILLSLTFCSCAPNLDVPNHAYLGGQIINPSSDYLILRNANDAIDTLYLDDKNRFSYRVNDLKPGLYSLVYGSEPQLILIEPADSILIRMNTIDIDESLVFSGKGAKKNNYLINLVNTQQNEFRATSRYAKLEPKAFQTKLDSIRDRKYKKLEVFNKKNDGFSELFKKISKATIDYNYYANKELYHSRHFGNNKAIDHDKLPKDFYAFRKTIDYNDQDLEVFHLYNNFLFPHFNNLAADSYFEIYDEDVFNRNSVEYNLIKLDLMDSLLHNKSIKNNLIRFTTSNFLARNTSSEASKRVFESFLEKSTNKQYIDNIKNFYYTLERLQPGEKFPEIEIVDTQRQFNTINKTSEKPKVIYFWRNVFKNHFVNSHKKAQKLRDTYPNVDFIAINIDEISDYVWKRNLKENDFDITHEYKFRNPNIAKRLLAISYVSKVIVIDANGDIINPNVNLFGQDLINTLKRLR